MYVAFSTNLTSTTHSTLQVQVVVNVCHYNFCKLIHAYWRLLQSLVPWLVQLCVLKNTGSLVWDLS